MLDSDFHMKILAALLPLARQHCSVAPSKLARQGAILEKVYLFHTILDEDDLYIKIIALNKIYNFSSKVVKILKKIKQNFSSILIV